MPPILSPRQLERVARSELPPAVVIGGDITGLTEARALARHGVPVFAVDAGRRRYTGYSKAFDVLVCREFAGPPLIPFLEQLARELPKRAALFVSMDEPVKVIGHLGQHLTGLYHFEFPAADDVDTLMSKSAFAQLAERRGWPMPKTYACVTRAQVEAAAREVEFPVIIKPQVKNAAFRAHSARKAARCDDAASLLAEYDAIARWEPEAVVQQWIPGGDDEVYFSFHYLSAALEEVCSFEGRKLRQWPPECGSTSMATGVARPRLHDLSLEILRDTRCAGFGAVEYKRDPRTDRFYITEPTVGRVNLQVGTAIANNVDTVSRAYFHLIGRPYPESGPATSHHKWLNARTDFKSARVYMKRGTLSWGEYLRSLRGPRHYAAWRLTDPGMAAALVGKAAGFPLRAARRVVRRVTGGAARATPAAPPPA